MTRTGRRRAKIFNAFGIENDATVFYGDCLKLLKTIPDASTQLIISSPPYNIGKPYEQRTSLDLYKDFQASVIAECVRVLRPGGSICWQVGTYVDGQTIYPLDIFFHPMFALFEESQKIRLRNRIVWHFEHGAHAQKRFSGRYETLLWYTKGDSYFFDLDSVRVAQKYPGKRHYKGSKRGEYSGHPFGKNPGDVWVFPNVKWNHVEKTFHPCQFPLELPSRLIKALSVPGDLVLDPFLGVGTTVAAAVLLNRRGAGAEIHKDYVDIARVRVRRAWLNCLPMRPERPVYEPAPGTSLTTLPIHFRVAAAPSS
jgi:adenine-specific DNA-methyltransferase